MLMDETLDSWLWYTQLWSVAYGNLCKTLCFQGVAFSVIFKTIHRNIRLILFKIFVFQTEILETTLLNSWRALFVIFLIAAVEETGGDSWKYSLRVSTDWKKNW